MKRFPKILLPFLLIIVSFASAQFREFVTANGDKLMEGDKELRFISYDIPNLHYIEDNHQFTNPNPWRIADEFEIRDALTAVRQMGGRVTRLYVISVRKEMDDPQIIRHVNAPGKFDEDAFKAYDKVLQVANEVGVRVIIPLVDNWWWWGGPKEYAGFRGKEKNEFWTDSLVISDFKKTVEHIVNRVNTYTGVPFKDDKAILGWETGNELEPTTYEWTRTIAAYIKSLDKNHLVIEGTHRKVISDDALADTNIDVLSTHHYVPASQMIPLMLAARGKTKGKKPYFVGEFGFMPTDSMRVVLDSVISSGLSGILVWSMRQHNRDGGFYYHGEAYRWPGFASGAAWDELNVTKLFYRKAFEINHFEPQLIPVPAPPTMLPVVSPYELSWQGSAGASSYIIERKSRWRLFWWQWDVVDSNASDVNIRYRPLYSDTTVEVGKTYYYRIRARNASGISGASELSGPVVAQNRLLIDEFENENLIAAKSSGARTFLDPFPGRAREDQYRLAGKEGDYVVYRLPGAIDSVVVDAFYMTATRDSNIVVASGTTPDDLTDRSSEREVFEPLRGEYRVYAPVRYVVREIPPDHRLIKIRLANRMQIGRLEIGYGDPKH